MTLTIVGALPFGMVMLLVTFNYVGKKNLSNFDVIFRKLSLCNFYPRVVACWILKEFMEPRVGRNFSPVSREKKLVQF